MRLLRNSKTILRRSYHGGFYEQTVESVPAKTDLGKAWKEFSAAFLAQAELDKGGLRLPTERQNEDYQNKLESDDIN